MLINKIDSVSCIQFRLECQSIRQFMLNIETAGHSFEIITFQGSFFTIVIGTCENRGLFSFTHVICREIIYWSRLGTVLDPIIIVVQNIFGYIRVDILLVRESLVVIPKLLRIHELKVPKVEFAHTG